MLCIYICIDIHINIYIIMDGKANDNRGGLVGPASVNGGFFHCHV